MANYCGFTRTNYFRVTDEERYKELFEGLHCGEDTVQDFTETDKNGVIWHGFGAYDTIEWNSAKNGDDEEVDFEEEWETFESELGKILPEDEAVIIMEVGYEKLRHLIGYSTVITKAGTRHVDLREDSVNMAREMLHNPDFKTVCEY